MDVNNRTSYLINPEKSHLLTQSSMALATHYRICFVLRLLTGDSEVKNLAGNPLSHEFSDTR
jgi:hypothetical protein